MPPAKWFPKNRKVLSWSIFTTRLELTLSKIREKGKIAARFARGIPTPAARRLTAASKARKNFFFFWSGARNFFQLRNEIFAGFASLLTQGRAASHPSRSFGAESRRAKIPFPRPLFLFARMLGQSLSRIIPKGFVRGPQIFFGGRATITIYY